MRRPVRDGIDPAVPAVAASGTDGATEQLEAGVFRTVLPSGTIILSERMDSVRSVALGYWFRSGTAHEPPGLRGIAHLLEHMVFKGTARRSARHLPCRWDTTLAFVRVS